VREKTSKRGPHLGLWNGEALLNHNTRVTKKTSQKEVKASKPKQGKERLPAKDLKGENLAGKLLEKQGRLGV